MAFTAAEKAQIRQVLGFSELFHDLDPRLEGQMIDLGTRAPDAVTRIQNTLVALTDIDARLVVALDDLSLVKAEDITFQGEGELESLRNQGRMLIQQIAITFELVPKRDYYGSAEVLGGGVILLG